MPKVLLILILLALSPAAQAWGYHGHRLICGLAQERLTPEAAKMVAELLAAGAKLEGGEEDFAESCVWPDRVKRRTHKSTYEHHFINVPDEAAAMAPERDCAALNCTAVGIQRALTYLSRDARGRRERARKAEALRFLGHYVGDLHQPLHVGNAGDLGGNTINVIWYGRKSNLHRVWDHDMLHKMNIRHPDSLVILRAISVQRTGAGILGWFNESLRLARSNAYVHGPGQAIRPGDTLGDDYLNRNKPLVLERLALAADRLAHLLDDIAAGGRPQAFVLKPGDWRESTERQGQAR